MKVKSITLQGFKSFADRTRLEFHDGITAVVGPNGCGKSNISDALRWVLGEQRPTAIRGSRMEEAIFGGSKERRPIHRAEVALELSNEDRTLPVPYSEVVIGRTVYRGGESEYTINGAACRLKDIHDLCRDTGLGTNAYAIIEARMIDAILSDRAEERRALFEEAAGIGRYKDRRRAALRRLEQAESDLQRLEDVLSEIRSKVRSLARQRGRAERFGKLRTRRLQLEVAVADARLVADDVRLERARARLESLRRDHPGEQAGLRTLETEAEALRLRLTEDERERADLARSLDETRKRLEERERERLVASERAAAARERLEALARELERLAERRRELDEEAVETGRALELAGRNVSEMAELEAPLEAEVARVEGVLEQARAAEEAARESLGGVLRELGSLEAGREAATERLTERVQEIDRRRAEIEELRAEADRLREERAAAEREAKESSERERRLDRELAACRGEVDELREAGRGLRAKVAELEGDLSAMRARESSLADFLASGGGVSDTVRELLAGAGSIPGIEGALAEFIRVPSELAGAVEAHLGLYLHGLVVKDWESVAAVRRWLAGREDDSGVLLLPLDPGPRPPAAAGPAGTGDLLSRVEATGAGAPWVRALLAGVSLGRRGSFAPAAGAWTLADGSGQDPWGAVRLGPLAGARGALTRRAELEELTGRSAGVERELEAARRALEQTELSLARTVERADALEGEVRSVGRQESQKLAVLESVTARLERNRQELQELETRLSQLEASREAARSQAETGAERLERLQASREAAARAVLEARQAATAALDGREEKRAALHDLQLRMARKEADLAAVRERAARLEEARRDVKEAEARLVREREAQRQAAEKGESAASGGEDEVAALLEERSDLESRLRAVEQRLEAGREELERRERELHELRSSERAHTEARHALELEISELEAGRTGILELLKAEWGAPLEELRGRVEPPEEGDHEEWAAELEQVRQALLRLGPVNLLAEQEYVSEKERLDFLTEQREDLLSARDDLRNSIRQINQSAAEAFGATFEQIRGNFQRTFHTLFDGGECDLRLEDPADPLDSPIEISARPRGKRTQRIHLLSGGERALTALALLFAIYLAKPSPFCLLDEVDAPLDETNIGRFINMLHEFKAETQFIVITHSARTIESADWIYGVTMQEPGVSSIVGVRFEESPNQVA